MLTKLYKLAEANNRTWLHVPSGTYCSPVEISAKKLEYKSINAIPHRINNIIIHALFNTEIWFCFYPHLLYLFQGILNRRRPLSISDFFIIKCNKLWSGVVRICTFFLAFEHFSINTPTFVYASFHCHGPDFYGKKYVSHQLLYNFLSLHL